VCCGVVRNDQGDDRWQASYIGKGGKGRGRGRGDILAVQRWAGWWAGPFARLGAGWSLEQA